MDRRIAGVLIALVLLGCSRTATIDYGRTPLTAPGAFRCFNNQLLVTVHNAADGKLSYSVENARVGVGSATPTLKAGAPWMIFPDAIDKVWIFDGKDDVTLVEIYPNDGTKFTSSQVVPELMSRAPTDFVDLLPASFTQKPR
jgi:hypothetical protein